MKWLKRVVMGLVATLIVASAGASMWFWFTPVGVNNYINKVTFQLAIDSPELLTYLGAIDNTLSIFIAASWPTTLVKRRNGALQSYARREPASMRTDLRGSLARNCLPGKSLPGSLMTC